MLVFGHIPALRRFIRLSIYLFVTRAGRTFSTLLRLWNNLAHDLLSLSSWNSHYILRKRVTVSYRGSACEGAIMFLAIRQSKSRHKVTLQDSSAPKALHKRVAVVGTVAG